MATKQKCVIHLAKGDIVVTKPGISTVPSEWPVISVEDHKTLSGYIAVSYGYDATEPDGKGGTKIVTHATGPISYERRENVQVLVR